MGGMADDGTQRAGVLGFLGQPEATVAFGEAAVSVIASIEGLMGEVRREEVHRTDVTRVRGELKVSNARLRAVMGRALRVLSHPERSSCMALIGGDLD